MNRDEIEALVKKRNNLNLKVKEWVKKNKNAYQLVVEFESLTNVLKAAGRNVAIQSECLKIENWEKGGKYYHLREELQVQPTIIQKEQNTKPSNNSYVLNLSWTELFQSSEPKPIKMIQDFLSKLGLKETEKDINNNGLVVEHTIKYEYNGSDDAFNVLKAGSQFILDTFSKSDYEKFNIAIYGKKQNY